IGRGALAGILIKNAEALEILEKVDTLIVDKTGTLTEGKPRLVTVEALSPWIDTDVVSFAASVAAASEHPISEALVEAAEARGLRLLETADFRSLTGRGITGRVKGRDVTVGSRRLLAERASSTDDALLSTADRLGRNGESVTFVVVDGRAAGLVGLADPLKSTTPEAVQILREEGIEVIMATGDSGAVAEAVAGRLGLTQIHTEVLPQDKEGIVAKLQSEGRIVAMAGDGTNDAPALARAHVGFAMGTGTDVAAESAGITLVKGDLRGIARARRLSRGTMRNIRENLFFAFVYNALGVPIAAGLLYPFFGLALSPLMAGAAMSLSSLCVVANALRLRSIDL
ncbi:MAG: HAD-IC family P-type ATPase, partial [Vicinamibacteria bacterium]